MADREKVAEELLAIKAYFPGQAIEAKEEIIKEVFVEAQQTIENAISMLKEKEAKEGHWIVLEFCANEGIYCSECHMKIFDRTTKPKKKLSQYCPNCGSRNERFFMDGEVVFR